MKRPLIIIALGLMIVACCGGNNTVSDSLNAVDTLETETKATGPYIRIRPIHSEDGGLSMTWSF